MIDTKSTPLNETTAKETKCVLNKFKKYLIIELQNIKQCLRNHFFLKIERRVFFPVS